MDVCLLSVSCFVR